MAFAAAGVSGHSRARTQSLSGASGIEPKQLGQAQMLEPPDVLDDGASMSTRDNFRKSRQSFSDHFVHHHHDHHNKGHHHHDHSKGHHHHDHSKGHHHHDHNKHLDAHKSFEDLERLGQHGLRKLLADQLAVVQQALLASQRSIIESLESVLEQGEKDAQQVRVLLIQAGAPAAAMTAMVNEQTRKTMLPGAIMPEKKKVSIMPGPADDARKSMMPGMPLTGVMPPAHRSPNAPMPPGCFKNGNTLSVHPTGGTPARGSARGNLQIETLLSPGHCEEGREKETSNAEETCVEPLALTPEPPVDQPVSLPCPNVPIRQCSELSRKSTMEESHRSSMESEATYGIASEDSQDYQGCQQACSPTVIKFYVSHAWTKENESEAAKIGNIKEVRNKSLIKAYTKTDFQEELCPKTSMKRRKFVEGHFHNFVIYPYSVKRALWDAASLLIVLYDLIMIPFELFDPGESTFTDVMVWIVRFFWTVDIPLSFITGYMMSDGVIEMRMTRIARHYLHTWFTLDFLLVVMDWVETLGTGSSLGYARMGKASRTFRILRMVRLLRLFRMREVLRQVSERVHSERLTIVLDITKMMVIILGLAHVLACLWYGIGVAGSSKQTWVRVDPDFEDAPLENRYIKSLHWSLSQFSGGMDEINPRNFIERMFASGAFVMAFIMAAVFVSGLTSSMTRLDILASYQSKQLAVLRRYLLQNRISDKLTLRVQRNAIHAMSEQQRLMQESSVDLLQVVSEPLRVELHFEMYAGVLEVHPLFHRYIDHGPQVMRRVCHLAASTLLVSKGDLIFNAGEIPTQPKMYIVCTGSFEYVPIAGEVSSVEGGSWLSEACLWVPWMHRGVLKAVQDGRLCLLDSNRFAHVATQFVTTDFNPRFYAEKFVQHLNRCEDPLLFTDLPLGIEHHLVEDAQNRNFNPADSRSWLKRIPSIFMSDHVLKAKRRQSAFFEKVMPK